MRLVRHGPDGRSVSIDLPEPDVAWVSAGPGGLVLATTLDGRALLGRPGDSGGRLAWRPLVPSPTPGSAPIRLTFGAISRDGTVAAFLGTDSAPPDAALVRIEIATGRTTTISLDGEGTGWPPVWIGSRLVVVRRVAGDRVEAVVAGAARLLPWVEPTAPETGAETIPGEAAGFAGIAGSADDLVVALLGRDRRIVRVVGSGVVDGPGPSCAPCPSSRPITRLAFAPLADGSDLAAWIALAPDGGRLAVVRIDAEGDARAIEIRASAAGWAETARLTLPAGADRAVAAWAP